MKRAGPGGRFEQDLRGDPVLMELLQSRDFVEEMYDAMCNVAWMRSEDSARWSCTWRTAGEIVASLRGENEDYIDYYCSGSEGSVSPRVRQHLARLGWTPVPESN